MKLELQVTFRDVEPSSGIEQAIRDKAAKLDRFYDRITGCRVVVAAEGAGRFFRADGVNADELGELFDLAGWRRANSFTQTLRNAARSKFGWLERIPGRSGRYAATDLGRSVTMGG